MDAGLYAVGGYVLRPSILPEPPFIIAGKGT